MLSLIGITNDPELAIIAENAGVDRIMVDMEYIGKEMRQGGMDSVKSHHIVEDVKKIRSVLKNTELLVRINPIHEKTKTYGSSAEEIEQVIAAGADRIMLPYFKTPEEVELFLKYIGHRTRNILLLETDQAVRRLDEILNIEGIDEVHIGLNDLTISQGKSFMFEVLADGTIEYIARKLNSLGMTWGFGGTATIGGGILPAENIIGEHYRLGSHGVILSRSFFKMIMQVEKNEREMVFKSEVMKIRSVEKEWELHPKRYAVNKRKVKKIVAHIIDSQNCKGN